MWRVTVLAACIACGGAPPPESVVRDPPPRPIAVEWKVAQGEGELVDIALVVDGSVRAIGSLRSAAEMQSGPSTCALRAAAPHRTEIVCGDDNAFAAELADGQLVVTLLDGDQRSEVTRIPVAGDVLVVQMLALPIDR